MPLNQDSDEEILKKGLPYVRSILAFILHVRVPTSTVKCCYEQSDKFITQLKSDLEEAAE